MNETIPTLFLVIGFTGQALFSTRFIIQWLVSEKKGESVIPMAFWYFSVAGGMTLLTYAILRQDPVFILGQAGGLVVYTRNLMLIRNKKLAAAREIAE
ncbi:MAG: lipid-A-disaccharide synthase N-terminal domain-containing protein [Thermoanaerobaculales bacterium]|jgi:lipid-A-disaccharide synthase-like uncharacterized protein|nr:lipid-A-disaccharide synthase N-terminal domain-containing protein [Thermoanaerobaculales bacterium]